MDNVFVLWMYNSKLLLDGTALADLNCAPRNVYMKPLFSQALETGDNSYEKPRQTSIDKVQDSAVKSERNALVEVSDPP